MKLRKGDTVVVIAGKDKGKQGVISSVLPKENKVIVAGVNTAKRHTKATHASNVMLVVKGKPARVGYKTKADGTKVRVAKKTGDEV